MNFGSLWLIALLIVCAVYLLWIFVKPKKMEQKRFNLKERRLKRQAEKEETEN